jgi:hypothetical protein
MALERLEAMLTDPGHKEHRYLPADHSNHNLNCGNTMSPSFHGPNSCRKSMATVVNLKGQTPLQPTVDAVDGWVAMTAVDTCCPNNGKHMCQLLSNDNPPSTASTACVQSDP